MTYECIGAYAVKPYYIEGICLNVYSLEELLYYLKGNAYLLDRSLMDEGLLEFISDSLKLPDLSEELAKVIRRQGSVADFVCCLFAYAHYVSEDELEGLRRIIEGNADLRGEIRKKTRGDFFFENGRYAAAGEEYLQAIQETSEEQKELRALLYHNLGVVYTKAFLFAEAADCFRSEIELLRTDSAIRDYLLALKVSADKAYYTSEVLRLGPDEAVVKEAESIAAKAEEKAERGIAELKKWKYAGRQEFLDRSDKLIAQFKAGYRVR